MSQKITDVQDRGELRKAGKPNSSEAEELSGVGDIDGLLSDKLVHQARKVRDATKTPVLIAVGAPNPDQDQIISYELRFGYGDDSPIGILAMAGSGLDLSYGSEGYTWHLEDDAIDDGIFWLVSRCGYAIRIHGPGTAAVDSDDFAHSIHARMLEGYRQYVPRVSTSLPRLPRQMFTRIRRLVARVGLSALNIRIARDE